MDRELWSVYDEMASSHVAPHPYNADYDRPTVLAGSATPRGRALGCSVRVAAHGAKVSRADRELCLEWLY